MSQFLVQYDWIITNHVSVGGFIYRPSASPQTLPVELCGHAFSLRGVKQSLIAHTIRHYHTKSYLYIILEKRCPTRSHFFFPASAFVRVDAASFIPIPRTHVEEVTILVCRALFLAPFLCLVWMRPKVLRAPVASAVLARFGSETYLRFCP